MAETRAIRFLQATRLERMVLSELVEAFGLALGGFTAVMVVGGIYSAVLDGAPSGLLLALAPSLFTYALPWAVPMAFVAACILVYSRMAASNELTAVQAAGIHMWRLLAPALMMALVLSAACALLNHEIVPRTSFYQYGVMKGGNIVDQVAAIRQSAWPVMQVGQTTVYIREVQDDGFLRDVVIVMPEKVIEAPDTGRRQVQVTYISAPKGRVVYSDARGEVVFYLQEDPALNTPSKPEGGQCVICKTIHGTSPRDFDSSPFRSAEFPIKVASADDVRLVAEKPKHLTTSELITKVRARREDLRSGAYRPPDGAKAPAEMTQAMKRRQRAQAEAAGWRGDIHRRSAFSLAPILLAAIAVPVGVMTRRGRRLTAFGLALAIVLGYYVLMVEASQLGETGVLEPELAIWGTNAVVAAGGLVLTEKLLRR